MKIKQLLVWLVVSLCTVTAPAKILMPVDGTVACVKDGRDVFISPDRWNAFSQAERNGYTLRGLVVNTGRQVFVISPDDINEVALPDLLHKSSIANIPSVPEADVICNNISQIQKSLKTLKGFTPLDGRYWIHMDNKDPQSANDEFLFFNSSGIQGSVGTGTVPSYHHKIREVLPAYRHPYVGFDIKDLAMDVHSIDIGLELCVPGGRIYIPYKYWPLVPEEVQDQTYVSGILVGGSDPFVVSCKAVRYNDYIMVPATVAYRRYREVLPTKEQGEMIVRKLAQLDDAMMDVKGDRIGGGVTRDYFNNDFKKAGGAEDMYGSDASVNDSGPYHFVDQTIFLNNDGKVEFISPDLDKDNTANVRTVSKPEQ